MDHNIYAIRKAILADLKACASGSSAAPITAAELAEISVRPAIRHSSREAVVSEFNELKLQGYIESISGFGGEYCRISKKGLEQCSTEFPQDTFVYGPGAIR